MRFEMFEIELKKRRIDYIKQEYDDDIDIYKIKDKVNILHLCGKSSTFSMERDLFYYINNQQLSYALLLENVKDKKVFFIEFKNKNNWLSSSFSSSDKEELFLGKQIMNYPSSYEKVLSGLLTRLQ